MEAAKIVLLALAIYCGYGAAFGEVCVWISPEAYTAARGVAAGGIPLAVLGPLWGIFDFLPFAAGVGIGIALAAHVGDRPAVKAFFFRRPLLVPLPFIAAAAALVGWLAQRGIRDDALTTGVLWLAEDRKPAYAATWAAMLASQVGMLIFGIALAVWTWKKRAVFERMVRERRG